MKAILTITLVLLAYVAHSQTFYVHCEDKKSREYIQNQIEYFEYKTITERNGADFTIECSLRCTSKINSMYKGRIFIIDNSTADTINTTKEIRRGAVAVNGYNASFNIFKVICKRYLPDLLDKCKTYEPSR